MESLPHEIKTLIHHVLHRHNVYKLELNQLRDVLHLLQQTTNEDPTDIQEHLFRGVAEFNKIYKDNISKQLSDEIFEGVPFQIKSIVHQIMHEFNFLNSIRAWEMFLPHYQQPGTQSQGGQNGKGELLDDQLEKAKLHYLYYGPMSVYHFNQQMSSGPFGENYQAPPLPPPPPPQLMPPQQQLQNQFQAPVQYRFERKIQYEAPVRSRGRPPNSKNKVHPNNTCVPKIKPPKPQLNQNIVIPKQKKLVAERILPNDFFQKYDPIIPRKMDIQASLNVFRHCLCQGEVKNDIDSFKCSKCDRMFHIGCVESKKECLACRQADSDPFVKMVSLIKSFPIDWGKNNRFQHQVNLVKSWNTIKYKKYEFILSCGHPSQKGLYWPDDIIIKINDYPVVEVPALLQAHHNGRRKDRGFVVTPYIGSIAEADPSFLEKIKISIQIREEMDNVPKRKNNRNGLFQICLFLGKELTPEDVLLNILEENTKFNKLSPFDRFKDQDVEVDRFSLSLFDPYSGLLMEIPARGMKCKHFQCFNLKSFLKLTHFSEARDWRCPYCHEDSRKLMIDKYQLSLLEQVKRKERLPRKVTIFRSGKIDYQYNEPQQLQIQQKINPQ